MKIKINLPKSWNELSTFQLERMALLFHTGSPGAKFDVNIFLILANCRWYTFLRNYRVMLILKNVPVSELRKFYAFIYKENNRTNFAPSILPIKERLKFWKHLRPPGQQLLNITAEEFAALEDFHKLWLQHKKEADRNVLEYMAAVLYQARNRQYDKLELPELAKRFNQVPFSKLLAMELVYFGSKNAIVKRFKDAFKKGGKTKAGGKQYGFGKVILNAAGGKFGTHKETRQTNIYIFLEEFEENLKQVKK